MTNPEHPGEEQTNLSPSFPTETETKPLSPLDQIQNLMIKEKFFGTTSWTARGVSETLPADTEKRLAEALSRNPNEVVITLQKLPDGGFEIKTFAK